MSMPDSPIPAILEKGVIRGLSDLISVTRHSAVATLAAAIITARGKPISIEEALEINNDLHMAMFPRADGGALREWQKTKDAKLAKVHD